MGWRGLTGRRRAFPAAARNPNGLAALAVARYESHQFRDALRLAQQAQTIDPTNANIYYAITGIGAPVAAPTIHIAPTVNSAVAIRFVYIPTLAVSGYTVSSTVPIPGEADNALIAWTIAYARAKERDDQSPDPGWIAIYATEKQNLLQSSGQRQLQEPSFAKAMFEEYWG